MIKSESMCKELVLIKPYNKTNIAKLYGISRKKLMTSWISEHTEIYELFEETGYNKQQQFFTLKQVEIIFETFGHPETVEGFETQKSHKRVPIHPYSKSILSELYGIEIRPLMKQINDIPDETVLNEILCNPNPKHYYIINPYKKEFSMGQVKLIFEWLGHPFRSEVIYGVSSIQ